MGPVTEFRNSQGRFHRMSVGAPIAAMLDERLGGEVPITVLTCGIGSHLGYVVVTASRVLIQLNKMIGGSHDLARTQITNMRTQGLTGVAISGAGMDLELKSIGDRGALLKALQSAQESSSAASTAAPELDVAGKLQQLADLHRAGALSDEEFSAAKARILAS